MDIDDIRNDTDSLRMVAILARLSVIEHRQERIENLFLEQEITLRQLEKLLGEFHVKLMRLDPPLPTD